MSRMLIVDGMSVLKTTAGGTAFLTNGFSYNFFTQLTATINKFKDIKGVIVCWEGGFDHRSQLFPDYKAHRPKSSGTEIHEQREIVKKLLTLVGIDQVYAPGFEGDDVGAWLVQTLNVPMVLYSNDKDWLQLVKPGVSIYQKSAMSEGKKNLRVEITREKFEHYTGFPTPEDFLTCKCIVGDDGDLGPQSGLVGVGDSTIKAWIYNSPVQPAKLAKIKEFLESEKYARNRLLIDLIRPKTDINPVFTKGAASEESTLAYLTEIGWLSIVDKFPKWWATYESARL